MHSHNTSDEEEILKLKRDELLKTYHHRDDIKKLLANATLAVIKDKKEEILNSSKLAKKDKDFSKVTLDELTRHVSGTLINTKAIELELERIYDNYLNMQAKDLGLANTTPDDVYKKVLDAFVDLANSTEFPLNFNQQFSEQWPSSELELIKTLLKDSTVLTLDDEGNVTFKNADIKKALVKSEMEKTENEAQKDKSEDIKTTLIERHAKKIRISPNWGSLKPEKAIEDRKILRQRMDLVYANATSKVVDLKNLRENLKIALEVEEALKNIPADNKKAIENAQLIVLSNSYKYKGVIDPDPVKLNSMSDETRQKYLKIVDSLRDREIIKNGVPIKIKGTISNLKENLPKKLKSHTDVELLSALPEEITKREKKNKKLNQDINELMELVIAFNSQLEKYYMLDQPPSDKEKEDFKKSYEAITKKLNSMNAFRKDKFLQVYRNGVALWSKLHQVEAEKIAKAFGRLTLESSLAGYLFDGLSWGTSWKPVPGFPMKEFWGEMSKEIAETSLNKPESEKNITDDDELVEQPDADEKGWVHFYVLEEVVSSSAAIVDEWNGRIEKYIKENKLNGIKMFVYDLVGNTRDRSIFILDQMPRSEELKNYADSYIFIKNANAENPNAEPSLLYIKPTGENKFEVEGLQLHVEQDHKTLPQNRTPDVIEQQIKDNIALINSLKSDNKTSFKEKDDVPNKSSYGTVLPLRADAQVLRNIIEQNAGHKHQPEIKLRSKEPVIVKKYEDFGIKEVDGKPSQRFIKRQQGWQDRIKNKKNYNKFAGIILRSGGKEKLAESDKVYKELKKKEDDFNALPPREQVAVLDKALKEQIKNKLDSLVNEILEMPSQNKYFQPIRDKLEALDVLLKNIEKIEERVNKIKSKSPSDVEEITEAIRVAGNDINLWKGVVGNKFERLVNTRAMLYGNPEPDIEVKERSRPDESEVKEGSIPDENGKIKINVVKPESKTKSASTLSPEQQLDNLLDTYISLYKEDIKKEFAKSYRTRHGKIIPAETRWNWEVYLNNYPQLKPNTVNTYKDIVVEKRGEVEQTRTVSYDLYSSKAKHVTGVQRIVDKINELDNPAITELKMQYKVLIEMKEKIATLPEGKKMTAVAEVYENEKKIFNKPLTLGERFLHAVAKVLGLLKIDKVEKSSIFDNKAFFFSKQFEKITNDQTIKPEVVKTNTLVNKTKY